MRTMKTPSVVLAALCVFCLMPAPASADATLFLGRTIKPTQRSVKGVAVSMSLLIVGFEFEYADTPEDATLLEPSLRTTSGNVFAQSFPVAGFRVYVTTGAGFYRERLGPDQETSFLLNNGGGVKVGLLGPLRARVDYRIFNLRGHPQHATVQRIYAGLNLAF
jgi:hypothetical protein